jgi:hypothetical protein
VDAAGVDGVDAEEEGHGFSFESNYEYSVLRYFVPGPGQQPPAMCL